MERVKSGIPGLDHIMGGGLPGGQSTLVSGLPGTGKIFMCGQFLYSGLLQPKENGIFLSFERSANRTRELFASRGWKFKKYEKQGRFHFIKYDPYHVEEIFSILESTIREIKAKRVVIDSVSALGMRIDDISEFRSDMLNFSSDLSKLGCTSILTSEIVPGSGMISRYGIEEFTAENVITLDYSGQGAKNTRRIRVWKMQGSQHSLDYHPYRITVKGVEVTGSPGK